MNIKVDIKCEGNQIDISELLKKIANNIGSEIFNERSNAGENYKWENERGNEKGWTKIITSITVIEE